jgi:hypothetical protein
LGRLFFFTTLRRANFMKKYLLGLLLIFFIALLASSLIFYPTGSIKKDVAYQLEDGSNVSLSEIISFQDDVVSEYNKNFERYPPENKRFYSDFVLNSSYSSEIDLTYYGEVLFCFGYANTANTSFHNFYYIGKNDTRHACNLVYLPNPYISNMSLFFSNFDGRSTNVKKLTHDTARQWASDFYDVDYSYYIVDNAGSSQNINTNYNNLTNAAKKLVEVLKTGTELEKERATIKYYQDAEEWGFSDESAKKRKSDLENNNIPLLSQSSEQQSFMPFFSLTYINFSIWIDGLWVLILLFVVGIAIPKFALYFKEREDRGSPETTAILRHVFDFGLSIIGIGGYIGFYIYWFGKIGIVQIAICISCLLCGLLLTWLHEKKREPQSKKQ